MSAALGTCRRVSREPYLFEDRRKSDRRSDRRPSAVSLRYVPQQNTGAEATLGDTQLPILTLTLALVASGALYWAIWEVGSLLLA